VEPSRSGSFLGGLLVPPALSYERPLCAGEYRVVLLPLPVIWPCPTPSTGSHNTYAGMRQAAIARPLNCLPVRRATACGLVCDTSSLESRSIVIGGMRHAALRRDVNIFFTLPASSPKHGHLPGLLSASMSLSQLSPTLSATDEAKLCWH